MNAEIIIMPFYNIRSLKKISESKEIIDSQRIINESKQNTKFDIFLSHCFLDKDAIKGLFFDLTSKGYKVYVDWIIDPQLDRSNVTKESAQFIRNRMKNSKSLLLAISTNAQLSTWMPWELGFVDGTTKRCAIVPVYESSFNNPEVYKGFEYLQLYPYVKEAPSTLGKQKLWVAENQYKYVVFDDFLNKNAAPFQRETKL